MNLFRRRKQPEPAARDQVDLWLTWLDIEGLSPHTIDGYRATTKKFLDRWPELALSEFTDEHIVGYIEEANKPSRQQRRGCFSNLFGWAYRTRRIPHNPMHHVPTYKQTVREPIEVFTEAECKVLCALPDPDGALMALLPQRSATPARPCSRLPRSTTRTPSACSSRPGSTQRKSSTRPSATTKRMAGPKRREANMSDATSRLAARVEEWKERDIAACQASSTSMARLRLSPEADTLSPGSDEGGVHFYESSITRSTGERLLSIVSLGRGMRLTTAQARELHDWIGAWLDPVDDAAAKPVVTVANRGVHLAHGEWVAWCACGFLETGWPNYEIAKASLSKHVERCERGR